MDERKRSLRKEIVRLALPIALQQFMTALVGACDAIMLGKLSHVYHFDMVVSGIYDTPNEKSESVIVYIL